MAWEMWLGVAAVAISAVALTVAMAVWSQQRRRRRLDPPLAVTEAATEDVGQLIAFVANPSKPAVANLERTVRRVCAEADLPEPLWLETTIEDPGVGQTREALARGADIVVAVGGDGTVRAVAEGMVGTGKPMGLVPLGTGNLLARNLDLPVTDPDEALRIVVAGADRVIDVGWARVLEFARPDGAHGDSDRGETDTTGTPHAAGDALPEQDTETAHIFLVIAGLGFDAAMVADADATLKARVGWVAYFVAGIRHLHGRRLRATIQLDDTPPVNAKLRTLLVGNCGKLPGGITLLPDAVLDDGILDVAAIDTRGGVVGWAQLFGDVVMQGFGVRNDLPAKIGRIDHARAKRVRVRVEGGEQAQVDGDLLGRAVELEAWVEPGGLVVRTA
ncbi:diacylglycerol kinase [Oerskovia turbata]|uniref:Diacylglycerol kinase n=1 Tax=Oerskovia turbata TaxID=1713 RepID=A0A4Q1KVU5_9CELL|nr:diacylglycerol kinase family protein [Oerskovia turbata]RXR25778.1 diacylglycerol kinase [Oerskovia turbata]RXR33344.1 diacylglycerol kinase [Oerskovia turbata]TGJ96502.1 diacylglycerol kinase [Actinotalea fermentans ATCC 43279 = JCM 9966 = DSM 3133]